MDGPQTHALAAHLTDLLTGHPIDRLDVPENRWQANMLLLNCVGQVIQRIRSQGKWLFFDFSHGISWATHLLARSAWRTQGKLGSGGAEKSKIPAARAPLLTLHLRHGPCATLTGHPLFLILPTETLPSHPHLQGLGPDPLTTASFAADFPPRLRNAAPRTLASALLDQDILAGVGNALKCEILFAARVHPSTRVGALLSSHIDSLCALIPELFQKHAAHHARAYSPKSALDAGHSALYSVYDRASEPCVVCQSAIAVDRSSSDGHWTWYCPNCQPMRQGAPGLFS